MRNVESTAFPVVPWTSRDVWLGLGGLVFWMVLSVVTVFLVSLLGLRPDLGVYIALAEAILLIPPWLLAVRKYHVSWGSLGLRRFPALALAFALAILIVFYVFSAAYGVLLQNVFHVTPQASLREALGANTWSGWVWIGTIGIAPIVEEIFFRGFVFGGLRQSMGWKNAALVSAALFAAVHLDLPSVLPIFLLGYAFAYLYNLSHSIFPTILMHMVINAVSLSALFLLTG